MKRGNMLLEVSDTKLWILAIEVLEGGDGEEHER